MTQVAKLAQKTREMAAAREAAVKERAEARQNAANAMMERELVLGSLVLIQGGPIVIPHETITRAREFVGRVQLEAVEVEVIVPRPRAFFRRLKQRFFGGGPAPKVRALQVSIREPEVLAEKSEPAIVDAAPEKIEPEAAAMEQTAPVDDPKPN